MKSFSVIGLAKLYGMTRQAVYKQINKGNLSKKSDGRIDLAEAIRVFGEPSEHVTGLQTTDTQKVSQVNMLQKQLELANEREQFQREELKAKNGQLQSKDEQIESLQRLLGAPKKQQQEQAEQVQDLHPTHSNQRQRSNMNRY